MTGNVWSQEIPGVTDNYGLGVQNEVGPRLTEFCQENSQIIACKNFQQHKRQLHKNITKCRWSMVRWSILKPVWYYILCSQRWRCSLRSGETRRRADCGSHHKHLIAKFRLKLKKLGKTTRPFKYDLNQISYDYTVEERNRFKGLYIVDRDSRD